MVVALGSRGSARVFNRTTRLQSAPKAHEDDRLALVDHVRRRDGLLSPNDYNSPGIYQYLCVALLLICVWRIQKQEDRGKYRQDERCFKMTDEYLLSSIFNSILLPQIKRDAEHRYWRILRLYTSLW